MKKDVRNADTSSGCFMKTEDPRGLGDADARNRLE